MRIAVILHERHDTWAQQLRTRLADRPVRWYQTRSAADLEAAVAGLSCAVVLIDLGRNLTEGLADLARLRDLGTSAKVLVLDPDAVPGVPLLARELGATHVLSGFAAPPVVSDLLDTWVAAASRQADREGWSRRLEPGTPTDAESWIDAVIHDLAPGADGLLA
ncbi:hypothetical protein OJF2_31130 [Aquisphaera giovannonii]|uniref:Response regulatory domain-containing protein n=1 Tax=Aquisphaera giovannonii TaxID=406548 RepID=A0A5B9W1P1_9BACT|nr:hypothetical protein [Aquisphaera giovannonii]QEH34572.1 hypothetical protein OJF2_31130 [Aquisphaera giovannonii]